MYSATLTGYSESGSSGSAGLSFAMSAQRLATQYTFSNSTPQGNDDDYLLRYGRLGAGLGRLYSCNIAVSDEDTTSTDYDVDGSNLVFVQSCGRGSGRLMLRSAQGTRSLPIPPGLKVARLQLRGRYLALDGNYVDGLRGTTRLAVLDITSGAQVYGAEPPAGSSFDQLALQADGTVAAVIEAGNTSCGAQTVLGWYSVGEPRLHPLPCESVRGNPVALRPDRAPDAGSR